MTHNQLPYRSGDATPERPESEQHETHVLKNGAHADINLDHPLRPSEEVKREARINGTLVASIMAGHTTLSVYDTRLSSRVSSPFLIATKEYAAGDPQGFKGLEANEPVVFGREGDHARIDLKDDKSVSRRHFEMLYVPGDQELGAPARLTVRDCMSKYGTYVTANILEEENDADFDAFADHIVAGYTHQVRDRLKRGNYYGDEDTEAPYGYYRNHPIIGRDSTSVAGGVYGTEYSEFVVVDHKNNLIRGAVTEFMRRIEGGHDPRTLTPEIVLQQANHYTQQLLRYDLPAMERISRPHYYNQGIIELSTYVEHGVGVCRQQALLAALFTEAAIKKGYLAGMVGVERNEDMEANGAHAWAVFRGAGNRSEGQDIIIDPAQHYVGTRQAARNDPKRWRYYVPASDPRDGRPAVR